MGMFKFIVEDLKSDWETIKKMAEGKAKLQFTGKDIKKYAWSGMKDNWLWLWLILLAFLTGWFIAAKYYEIQCNQEIGELLYDQVQYVIQNVTYIDFK